MATSRRGRSALVFAHQQADSAANDGSTCNRDGCHSCRLRAVPTGAVIAGSAADGRLRVVNCRSGRIHYEGF